MDDVFSAVARVTSISYEKFSSPSRKKEIMLARQLFSHICVRDYCAKDYSRNGKLTLQVIGGYINRDHAAVINHCTRANNFILTEKSFRELLRTVEGFLVKAYGEVTDHLKFTLVDDSFSAPSGEADATATQDGLLSIVSRNQVTLTELSLKAFYNTIKSIEQDKNTAKLQRDVLGVAMQKIYNWWAEVEALKLPDTESLVEVRVQWTTPKRDMIDPLKEVNAARAMLSGGLKSPQEIAREMGFDYDDTMQEFAEADKMRDKLGVRVDTDARYVLQKAAPMVDNSTSSGE